MPLWCWMWSPSYISFFINNNCCTDQLQEVKTQCVSQSDWSIRTFQRDTFENKSRYVLGGLFLFCFLYLFFIMFKVFFFYLLWPRLPAQKTPWHLPDRGNRGFVEIVVGSRLFVADGQKWTLLLLMNTFSLLTFSLACFCQLAGQMHHGVVTSEEIMLFLRIATACPS